MDFLKNKKITLIISTAILIGLLFCSNPVYAEKGVIALVNNKCFIIDTANGYVLVDGYVNAPEGTVVIGNFNTYGMIKMFDVNGNELHGYIYIEEWGLSRSRIIEKWQDKCAQ